MRAAPSVGGRGEHRTAARGDRGVFDADDAAPGVSYRRDAPPPRVIEAEREREPERGEPGRKRNTGKATRAGSPAARWAGDRGRGRGRVLAWWEEVGAIVSLLGSVGVVGEISEKRACVR